VNYNPIIWRTDSDKKRILTNGNQMNYLDDHTKLIKHQPGKRFPKYENEFNRSIQKQHLMKVEKEEKTIFLSKEELFPLGLMLDPG
jgi:hypothetical protein